MSQRLAKDIIRECIDALGVSQKEFAKVIGVDPATVSRWVKGTQVPQNSLVALLADALGVDEVELWRAIAAAQRDENRDLRRDRDRVLQERDEMANDFMRYLARANEVMDRIEQRLDEVDQLSLPNGSKPRQPRPEVREA